MRRQTKNVHRLRDMIASIVKEDAHAAPLAIAAGLHVLSIVYGAVMAIRARLYQSGRLPSRELPCRVVSIGNITAGGTGKTPMTIFVAQTIRQLGYRVAVISRGYKGRLERAGGVVSDGRSVLCGPVDAGDEPYLMADCMTDIPVVVGRDRYHAGMLAVRRFAPDVIVLDDAFQHLRLKRDLDLVLLDHRAPLGNGYLLPRGRLREPVSALCRAHALIFTRSDVETRSRHFPLPSGHRATFHSIHVPVINVVHPTDDFPDGERMDFSILKGRRAVAFSGLADNDQFFDSLTRGGCQLLHRFSFDDHYPYRVRDLERIVRKAVADDADVLITTAKDWVKIQPIYGFSMAVAAVDVRIGWRGDPARIRAFLSAALSKPTMRC